MTRRASPRKNFSDSCIKKEKRDNFDYCFLEAVAAISPASPRPPITAIGDRGDLVAVGHGVGTVVTGRMVTGGDVVTGIIVVVCVTGAVTRNVLMPMKLL